MRLVLATNVPLAPAPARPGVDDVPLPDASTVVVVAASDWVAMLPVALARPAIERLTRPESLRVG
jgi:hypothetical protein